MASKELADGLKFKKHVKLSCCEGCIEGKMKKQALSQWEKFIQMEDFSWFTVMCGPMPTDSIGGSRYYVTFIDDYSRYC